MAHENQTAPAVDAPPAPKRRRGVAPVPVVPPVPVRVPVPASAPVVPALAHFLALPDNIFHRLFENLSAEQSLAPDAFNLAATCRRLNDYYRCNFVHALDLTFGPRAELDVLFRAAERLPCLHTLTVQGRGGRQEEGGPLEALLRVLRRTASLYRSAPARSSAARVRSLSLRGTNLNARSRDEQHMTLQCVRNAVDTYGGLQHLDLRCLPAVADDAVALIAHSLANSLQTLVLWYLNAALTDAGGLLIASMHHLRVLELHSCPALTDVTCDALRALDELVELELSDCSMSDAAACRLVPHLRKLKALDLSGCKSITSAIFSVLPPSLVTLELSRSGAVSSGVPPFALEGVPNLTSLEMRDCPGLDDLSFLQPVAPRLQVLCLGEVRLSDAHVARWVSRMCNLVKLDLAWSSVSDETARAVASLGKIVEARLNCTNISNDGVRALAAGIACQSLEFLDLKYCTNIRRGDGAVEALSEAISAKGFGKLHIPRVNIQGYDWSGSIYGESGE